MSVSSDAVARKVGVRQEAPLAVERTAVAVETLRKVEHYVGKLLNFVPYVAVGDFLEAEWGDALPHLEGLPDGFVGLVLARLRGVVLDAAQSTNLIGILRKITPHSLNYVYNFFFYSKMASSGPLGALLTYEKVMRFFCHFRFWMA